MIHTIHSNSYEVLRAVLLSNIDRLRFRPEAGELSAEELFAGVFDRVPVIIPSKAVETDLMRAIASSEGICAGMRFMFLSQWLGFFSKEPLANVIGNEAEWMIWRILGETGPGSLREEVARETSRLEESLRGRGDAELFEIAQRISRVFVSYASYRLDWVLEWLGMHQDRIELSADMRAERSALERDPDFFWQRALMRRLAESPEWRGRRFLEALPDTLDRLCAAPKGVRRVELGDGRQVELPNALHVFVPFVVPPLMLPVLKAYAHSGRDVWLYLLNPSSEYWFDLVPRRLFRWSGEEGEAADAHREIGHPILADNGRSTRANIDRLWRFTAAQDAGREADETDAADSADESPMALLTSGGESEATARRLRALEVEPHEPTFLEGGARFLRECQENPRRIEADIAADVQSFWLEAREETLLRRVQDSILTLNPESLAQGAPLIRREDESIRFVCAPTPARELEGLADWLQARFREDPTLTPSDVLVVTPDISALAPLIDEVFGSLPKGRRIDYRITGALTAAEDAPLKAMSGLAGLLSGRMRRAELLSWLALPIISKRLGLDADDIAVIGRWLEAAGFEFGLSDGHLLGLDPRTFAHVREGTLSAALERLALGAMLPSGMRPPLFGVLPVDGTETDWSSVAERPRLLSVISSLYAGLEELRLCAVSPASAESDAEAQAAALRDPERWPRWIARAIELFFPRETPDEDWQALRNCADALAGEIAAAKDAAGEPPAVPFELFLSVLASRMRRSAPGARPGSAVTFTEMSQMRGLPHRIIAVLGLGEDSKFPGSSRAEEFDLMSRHPRRGDRDSRSDNRNVFLDLLLAARETFLVSWSGGANPAQRSEPSVVAQELRDWLLSITPEGEREEARSRGATERAAILTVTLPLTAFSESAFSPERGRWLSTNADLLEAVAAARASGHAAPEAPFVASGVETLVHRRVLSIDELMKFVKAPETWLLRAHGILLSESEEAREAPVVPESSGLVWWKRINEMLSLSLSGGDEAERARILERWRANPGVGARGVREWALEADAELVAAMAGAIAQACKGLVSVPEAEISADVTAPDSGEAFTIRGRSRGLWRDPVAGEVTHVAATPSKSNGSGARRAIVEHLLLVAAGAAVKGVLICPSGKKGETVSRLAMPLLAPAEAGELLARIARELMHAAGGEPRFASRPGRYGAKTELSDYPVRMAMRGRDLEVAQSAGEALGDALTGLFGAADGKLSAALAKCRKILQ